MSYCRFLEGDAYIFMNVGGWLECCWCTLDSKEDFVINKFYSTQEMVDHVERHIKAGDYIPPDVIDNLWRDDEENFGSSKESKDMSNIFPFDHESQWVKTVKTKNPLLRAMGNISGVIASFFISIELKWGDVYEFAPEEE